MEKKYLKLNDIDSYKVAFNLSNYVWDLIIKWDRFNSDTIGKQFVRSVDSISANLAEGFGRYSKKDKEKIRYLLSLAGSMYEVIRLEMKKPFKRKFISKTECDYIFSELIKN
ncbi:MAG: four helix bundle protein [Ignavibacteriales bacterium]|nr:four helix bundle protein [Ignavibacteriales bacterium]